jgi:hypothetical protein
MLAAAGTKASTSMVPKDSSTERSLFRCACLLPNVEKFTREQEALRLGSASVAFLRNPESDRTDGVHYSSMHQQRIMAGVEKTHKDTTITVGY